jgi:hypothetical protein
LALFLASRRAFSWDKDTRRWFCSLQSNKTLPSNTKLLFYFIKKGKVRFADRYLSVALRALISAIWVSRVDLMPSMVAFTLDTAALVSEIFWDSSRTFSFWQHITVYYNFCTNSLWFMY